MSDFNICPMINTSTYSTSFTEEGNQHVYFSKTILGVIGFSNSINTILKTNKKSWEDFSFSKMTLQVQSRDTSLTSGFSIGLFSSDKPIGSISDDTDSILQKSVKYINCDPTIEKPTDFDKNVYSFSFLSLFQGLTKDDEQKFSPNSKYWYLALWHSTLSNSETFYSRNYSSYKLFENTDTNGSIVNQTMQFQIQGDFVTSPTSPFRYYEDNAWKILTPYIYDGKWIQLDAKMF